MVSAALTDTEIRVSSGFRGARIVLYGAVFDLRDRPSGHRRHRARSRHPAAHRPQDSGRGPVAEQPARWCSGARRASTAWPRPGRCGTSPASPCCATWARAWKHLAIAAPLEQRVETTYGVRDVVVSRLGADYLDWRRAVLRLKEKAGLYAADPQGVRFVDKGLFRAQLDLPAEVADRPPIPPVSCCSRTASRSRSATVRWSSRRPGRRGALYLFAKDRPWTYGLVSVIVALGAGWAASVAFRRS
ncbi:TIGR02186 family protein [Caulobacter segnis]